MSVVITQEDFNIHNLLAANNTTSRSLEIGKLTVKDTTSIIQLSAVSQRAVIRAGNTSTGETEIEGSIKFAVGNNPTFTLDSGDNNLFQFRTDSNYTFECYGDYDGISEYRERLFIGDTGIKMNHLAGTGTRMMVTDASGNISSQAIPQVGANFSNTNLEATGSRIHDFKKLYSLNIIDLTSLDFKTHSNFGNARLFLGSNTSSLESFTSDDRLNAATSLSVTTDGVKINKLAGSGTKMVVTDNTGLLSKQDVPESYWLPIGDSIYYNSSISVDLATLPLESLHVGGNARFETTLPKIHFVDTNAMGASFKTPISAGIQHTELIGTPMYLTSNASFSAVNTGAVINTSLSGMGLKVTHNEVSVNRLAATAGNQTPTKLLTVTNEFVIVNASLTVSTGIAVGPNPDNVSYAYLRLGQGTTTAAPMKFAVTSAAILTTPQPGAFETDGTDLYFTNSAGVRKKVTLT